MEYLKTTNSEKNYLPLALVLVLLASILSRILQLHHTPQYDEFYHLLVAREYLGQGNLAIADGEYTRGAFFTYLVAAAYSLFGDNILSARIMAVVPGILLILSVFVWTLRVASLSAACWTAFFMIFCPIEIYISQFVRFYALHALTFFLGTVLWYQAVCGESSLRIRFLSGAGAACLLLFSYYMQLTTIVGLVGLLFWTVLIYGWHFWQKGRRKALFNFAVGILVTAILALIVLWQLDALWYWWWKFRSAPGWAEFARENYRYYHDWFLDQYPTFWTLLPLAVLVGLVTCSRPAFFVGTVFVCGIVLHSIAGTKASRYIAYLLPFMFVLWGIVLAEIVPVIKKLLQRIFEKMNQPRIFGQNVLCSSLVVLLLAIVFSGNEAFYIAGRMITEKEPGVARNYGYRGFSDWDMALPVLKPLEAKSALVITSTAPKSLYYLGRSSLEINAQQLLYRGNQLPEYGIDPRIGRPIISDDNSLRQLMSCYPDGLVIIEDHHWRLYWAVKDAAADFIEANMTQVDVPRKSRLTVYHWDEELPGSKADCASIYQAVGIVP